MKKEKSNNKQFNKLEQDIKNGLPIDIDWLMNYAKEQTERVVQLENNLENVIKEKNKLVDQFLLDYAKFTINHSKLRFKVVEIDRKNKNYREAFKQLQDFVRRGEDECNIKQLIMMLSDDLLEEV